MISYSIQHISQIVGGKLFLPPSLRSLEIEQIVTDSRAFFRGKHALFFALNGPRHNGHNYIAGLHERGIEAVVVSQPEVISEDMAFILVEDTNAALQKLSAHHRSCFHYPVIGITGSNGKTIVKEWLHELLQEEFSIVRNPKSYNSQVGVPLSVLLMENHHNLGIFEAGISMPGEMEKLAPIIQPEIGILTNIGDAHQENFRSKKQKTSEKLKLFRNAKKLIYCADHEEVSKVADPFCKARNIEQVTWSAENREAVIRFTVQRENGFSRIGAVSKGKSYSFAIPFTDNSSIENACHCFAAALTISAQPEKTISRFQKLAPIAMRLEIKQGTNNCLLINDYYNSDLSSLAIALSVLHQQAKKEQFKKLIILSDIQQTGIPQKKLYSQVNQLLEQWGINEIIGIGPEISSFRNAFSIQKKFFRSTEDFERKFMRGAIRDAAILIKGARAFAFEKISALLQQKAHQTVLEIDLNALVNNLNVFRSLLRNETKIIVMVKAFSYGSGDIEIAKLLQFHNIDYLAVAVADEGVELRQAGIQTPVIVMNPEEHSFQNMIEYRLEPNIYSLEILLAFEKAVDENIMENYPVHIKLDTGMNRLGFKTEKEVDALISVLKKNNLLKAVSLFSHLAASDEPSLDNFTTEQFTQFEKLFNRISSQLPYKPDRHILNSAGIERFPEKQYEMVRLGIGIYGVSITGLPLHPISAFKSIISQVKTLYSGETTGYGRKGKSVGETKIAIIPVGYADGIDRKSGNGTGTALIKGKRVPIIGNVCMDMLMLDVTGMEVSPGDEVEFFGKGISISEVAKRIGTIPYEILTGISHRVKRIYLQE